MNGILRKQFAAAMALLAIVSIFGCSSNTSDVPEYVATDKHRADQIRQGLVEGSAAAGGGAEEAEPDGWGTLSGTLHFAVADAAKLAQRPTLEVGGQDASMCLRDGPIKSKELLVDAQTGALENVVIFFADNTSKKANPEKWVFPDDAPGANTTPVLFDQNVCMFKTPVVGMQVSQPLIIKNSDTVGHNTKLDNSKPISPLLAAGAEAAPYLHAKEEREPYKVACNIHPWMTAHILPRDNGYFAVTGKDGKFKLENLPADVDLTIKVWHASAGFIRGVTVDGTKQNWPAKGFTIKVPKGNEKSMDIVLDAGPFSN